MKQNHSQCRFQLEAQHDDYHEVKITLCMYLNSHKIHTDGRFTRNTNYIFYAQYLFEVQQVLSSGSIPFRKCHHKAFDAKVPSENLMYKNSLRKILKCDDGYNLLKPTRGTSACWETARTDLLAMLKLGNATWFCRWHEMDSDCWKYFEKTHVVSIVLIALKNVDCQEETQQVTIMFDHRFHRFLKEVIMSPANQIGKIKDYSFRVEFQQHGSPHTHCLIWV